MRNLNKPNRYNVASIQAQQTLGGDVMQSDEEGQYVTWRDYKWLLESYAFVQDQWKDLNTELQYLDLFKSVVEKFFNSADLKNQPDAQSCYALAEKLKQLPDCILDFTEEQVRDNPAWALAVFRHKVKEMRYKRVHDLNAIGGEQEENARLKAEVADLKSEADRFKAEVERLTERNKFLEQIDSYLQGANENAYEKRCDELEAEVERLRKAGDAMADLLSCAGSPPNVVQSWNAAKEGKQSEEVLWVQLEDYEKLKAEVERLRKAGDAMLYNMTYYKSFVPDNGNIHHMIDASILGWNPKYGHTTEYGKAKEGKQS